MADEWLVLVHDETGDEYPFGNRADYLAALSRGGYTEKAAPPELPRAAPAPYPRRDQAANEAQQD